MGILPDGRRNILKYVSCEDGVCRNEPLWRVGGADLGYGGVALSSQGKGAFFLLFMKTFHIVFLRLRS
jgi:hypothetical protein